MLLLASTWALPHAATAQTGVTNEGTIVDLITGEKEGSFQLFLEANYGLATPRFDGLDESFNTLGLLEMKLGYSLLKNDSPGIARFLEFYAFGTGINEG